jgi:translation elongation factor EF-G
VVLPKGQEPRPGGAVAYQADVPLAEMFGYVTVLAYHHFWSRNSTMEFSHYACCAKNVAERIIERKVIEKERRSKKVGIWRNRSLNTNSR